MTTVRLCKQCGAPLPVDAPEGLCPKCLMKAGAGDSSTVRDGSREAELSTSNIERSTSNETAGSDTSRISPRTTDHGPRSTIRYFGDYELLEEIARGGMGVVYKARQVSLNRMVAVKMILAGQFAGEAEVKRFHTEAEAAANLQHPNIVTIHEIGEHEGLHYFSMDYVAGKNLAQAVRPGPMPAVQAARLVKLMAEAIQYAHQRGILHRDLKPQNVLLDEREQPRITDFGLARKIEREGSLTVTGAVMGSPGYMAPEQAAGRQDQIGACSDIYGLGAILYHLITGKPPFAGATSAETILKVMEADPVAPRRLNPSTPGDLETICLKCLEKRPERRYSTARQLAEDLGRYLDQEPILARRASPVRRGWNWLQRHPWVITGVGSLALLGLVCISYGLWQKTRFLAWKQAHPGEVPAVGFEFLLVTYLLFCVVLFGGGAYARQAFRRNYERQLREGTPIPREVLLIYGGTGLLALIYGVGLTLKWIELTVWQQTLLWAFSVPAFLLLWSGAHDLWLAVGSHEYSTFHRLVQRRVEEAIDREREGRSTLLVHGLKLLFIGAVGCLSFWLVFLTFFFTLHPEDIRDEPAWIRYTALAAWFVPWLLLLPLPREGDVRRALGRKLVFSFWTWPVLAGGAYLLVSRDSAMVVLMGGFVGFLFGLVLAMIWVDRKPRVSTPGLTPTGIGRWSGLLRVARQPGAIVLVLIAGVLLFFTVRTGRAKWVLEAYGRELAAQGETLPRAFHVSPVVPDELNFAQTPLIRAIGYASRVDQAAWSRLRPFSVQTWVAHLDYRMGKPLDLGAVLRPPTTSAQATTQSRSEQARAVLAWMQAVEPELEELRRASARPAARLDPLDLQPGSSSDRNYLNHQGLGTLAGLCAGHASAELALGHPEQAMADLRIVRQLSVAVLGRGTLASANFGSRVALILVQIFWEGSLGHQWNEAQLAEFSQWFAAPDWLRDTDIGLRFVVAWDNRYMDGLAGLGQLFPFTDMFQSQLVLNRLMRESFQTAFDLKQEAVYPRRIHQLAGVADKERNQSLWLVSVFGFLDVTSVIQDTASLTGIRLALVMCALERYRLAQGRYPSSLDELTPRFLLTVPRDLINHQPLHYRLASDGRFSLYSVGWDEKDDGGVPATDYSQKGTGDWVWPSEAATK